jgi:hypothetical protein
MKRRASAEGRDPYDPGGMYGLLGPDGAGKSTLIPIQAPQRLASGQETGCGLDWDLAHPCIRLAAIFVTWRGPLSHCLRSLVA